ncbi:permease [Propionicicella superfundia]|uniref:permease n=1 Tax=Propionicicella superfundia TaxID=348582 RepID=UPI0009FEC278|nr:permease [Propionicicella superfundia]
MAQRSAVSAVSHDHHEHDHAAPPPHGARGVALRGAIGLAAVAALLALRLVADPDWTSWLPAAGRDLVTLSLSVLLESLPFVFLGIAISILVQIWLPDRAWRLLPRQPTLRRAALSVLGVLFPVCQCGNVPLARGLMLRGLGVGETLTFLVAAPILNPVTIITTYQAFGFDRGILVSRIVGAFVIANLVGWVFSRHPAPSTLLTPSFEAACAADEHTGGRWRRSAESFATETTAMLPALVAGSFLAGAIQVGVPRDVLLGLGGHPVLSVAVLMLLAFVVSLCSNVDAFFILAFASTFATGGIVAFLVFGAMVDIKMLALLRTTYTTRALILLTAVVGLCSLVLGLGLNLVL